MNLVTWSGSLAETGADSGVVTLLLIVAGALAGLGILLIVLRVVQRRRQNRAPATGSARPSVDASDSVAGPDSGGL